MKAFTVKDDDGKGVSLIIQGDVERRNPIEFLLEMHVNRRILFGVMYLKAQGIINDANEEQARYILGKQAVQNWPETIAEFQNESIPAYLTDLLSAKDKNEQIRLLKGGRITSAQLVALICKAWERGYTYSKYSAHHSPTGLDETQLPRLYRIDDDGSIEKVGPTVLSDGKLKQIIDQRKVIVATILDKGDDWLCFFATYRGLAGKENYKGGQPHMHFISSKWGSVKREEVIQGIRSGTYISNNAPHIDLSGFGESYAK